MDREASDLSMQPLSRQHSAQRSHSETCTKGRELVGQGQTLLKEQRFVRERRTDRKEQHL